MSTAPSAAELSRVERLVAIRSFGGWRNLPTYDLVTLSHLTTPLHASRGAVLLREGEPVERIFIVVEGQVRVTRGGIEHGLYGPFSGVGGLAAFARDPQGYRAVATQDSLVLAIDADDLLELFEQRFPVLDASLHSLCRVALAERQKIHPSAGFPEVAPYGEPCPARPLDLVERILFLRQNMALGAGSIDALAALARGVEELRLPEGERLWAEGDRADKMIAVVCGRIGATNRAGQRFQLGAGDVTGSLDALAQTPRWFDARVVDGMVGLAMSRDLLLDILEDHPDLGIDMLEANAKGLMALIEQRVGAGIPDQPGIT